MRALARQLKRRRAPHGDYRQARVRADGGGGVLQADHCAGPCGAPSTPVALLERESVVTVRTSPPRHSRRASSSSLSRPRTGSTPCDAPEPRRQHPAPRRRLAPVTSPADGKLPACLRRHQCHPSTRYPTTRSSLGRRAADHDGRCPRHPKRGGAGVPRPYAKPSLHHRSADSTPQEVRGALGVLSAAIATLRQDGHLAAPSSFAEWRMHASQAWQGRTGDPPPLLLALRPRARIVQLSHDRSAGLAAPPLTVKAEPQLPLARPT